MRGRLPLYVVALGLGLASGLLAAWLCHPATRAGLLAQGLWRAELISYDYRLSYAPTEERSEEIVLVTIDDESLSQEGLQVWPWPRDYHARVLQELKQAGARLIGLDVILAGVSGGKGSAISETGPLALPVPSKADRTLTEAIQSAGNVVLAMEVASSPVAGKEGAAELEVGSFPHEDFEDAALGLGSVNLPRDLDGVIRRAGVAVTFQEQSYPSMPIALAARYLRREPGAFSTEMLSEGRAEHPALGGRSVLLPYRAPVGAGFVRLPYYRVLQGDFDQAQVRGKVVLIGSTARSLQDLHYTPMAMRGVGGRGGAAALMSGVEILASATDALLHNRRLIPLAQTWTALLTVLVSALMALALVRLRPAKALFLAWLPLVTVSVVVSFELFWTRELWVPLVPLLLGVTLSYGAGTIYLELTAQRAQRQLRQAWSRRVSPEVLAVILDSPGLTRVGGRRLV
ncbi:MAG: CHASE2 domain-containing protein, partial [candidate division WS1 bacterium]|nr:CHASE2 domain-containing protein [candidate division WS1 bacterium]